MSYQKSHSTADEIAFIDRCWQSWRAAHGDTGARLKMRELLGQTRCRVFDRNIDRDKVIAAISDYAS